MFLEKPDTVIVLMKESSKLKWPRNKQEQRKLAKRLGGAAADSLDTRQPQGSQNKSQDLGDWKYTDKPHWARR